LSVKDEKDRKIEATNRKIEEINSILRDKIKLLVMNKSHGKILMTVELNMSEGGIGTAFIGHMKATREKIF